MTIFTYSHLQRLKAGCHIRFPTCVLKGLSKRRYPLKNVENAPRNGICGNMALMGPTAIDIILKHEIISEEEKCRCKNCIESGQKIVVTKFSFACV